MPQDAFTIKYIAEELKERLCGGKISKIIQPARDLVTFIIYTANGNVKLDACLSAQDCRLSLSESGTNAPQNAPNFCMLLRKHLQNARITDIAQPDFERIIYFDLQCVADFSASVMRLYFELMGKYSNAVLCENGVIVGALKTTALGENAKRVLFGGVRYAPPEPQDKVNPLDRDALTKLLKQPCADRTKFICDGVKGVSYATALEMTRLYGENLSGGDIYDYIFDMKREPCVTFLNGEPCDFKVRSLAEDKKLYDTLLDAQSAYYSCVTGKKLLSGKKSRLKNALAGAVKKTEKRLGLAEQKLCECADAEEIKLKGELLTANLYAVKRGERKFTAVNYYDEKGGAVDIELDATLTPAQNAQRYYKKYAKLKRTQASVTEQRAEALDKLRYYASIASSIESAESLRDLEETEEELCGLKLLKRAEEKIKKRAAVPYRAYLVDGFKIYAGRNNLQNDRLLKSLAPDDIWLHAQKYHSCHAAVITEGKSVPDGVLLAAAEICAYYSDGRDGGKIPVDRTLRKHVKKPPASCAGFVIYTDYKTMLAEPRSHAEECVNDERK